MSPRPALFTAADLARALKGAKAAGVKVARYEIEPRTGKISVFAGNPARTGQDDEDDDWKDVR